MRKLSLLIAALFLLGAVPALAEDTADAGTMTAPTEKKMKKMKKKKKMKDMKNMDMKEKPAADGGM